MDCGRSPRRLTSAARPLEVTRLSQRPGQHVVVVRVGSRQHDDGPGRVVDGRRQGGEDDGDDGRDHGRGDHDQGLGPAELQRLTPLGRRTGLTVYPTISVGRSHRDHLPVISSSDPAHGPSAQVVTECTDDHRVRRVRDRPHVDSWADFEGRGPRPLLCAPPWAHSSRSAVSACGRRSTRSCCGVRATSAEPAASSAVSTVDPPGSLRRAAVRGRPTRPGPGWAPLARTRSSRSLPAGPLPDTSPSSSRHAGQLRVRVQRRRLQVVAVVPDGPPSSSHARYTTGVEQCSGGVSSVNPSSWASGSSTSPIPRTLARPPATQKATSAPTSPPAGGSVRPPSAARLRRPSCPRPGRPRRDVLVQRPRRPVGPPVPAPGRPGRRRPAVVPPSTTTPGRLRPDRSRVSHRSRLTISASMRW